MRRAAFRLRLKAKACILNPLRKLRPYVPSQTLEVQRKWNIHKIPRLRPCKGPHKNLEAKKCLHPLRTLGMG